MITKPTNVETVKEKKSCAPIVPEKSNRNQNDLKEIKVGSIKRDEGKLAIGTRAFGSCYMARFPGLRGVQKEFNEGSNIDVETLKRSGV